MAWVTQGSGIGLRRGYRSAPCLPPSQRAGPRLRASVLAHGACHGAPSSRRCRRSAALRVAGTWAMGEQRWHTPALGALASSTCRPCQGKRMPPYSYRPALGGRREHGGHTPSWQGRAVRGGSPRGGVSIGLTASRTAPGSGCPLRPRGTGREGREGWDGWDVRTGGRAGRLPRGLRPAGGRGTRRRGGCPTVRGAGSSALSVRERLGGGGGGGGRGESWEVLPGAVRGCEGL